MNYSDCQWFTGIREGVEDENDHLLSHVGGLAEPQTA